MTTTECDMTPEELAARVKWLATEMDTVGSAMRRQAKSTGDDALRSAGWDLHDAASALLTAIKDMTDRTQPDAGRDLQDAADALKQALEQQHAHNA